MSKHEQFSRLGQKFPFSNGVRQVYSNIHLLEKRMVCLTTRKSLKQLILNISTNNECTDLVDN